MKIHTRFPVLFSYVFLVALPTLFMPQLKAQYILAGVHGAYDYYAAPDTLFSDQVTGQFNYLIDINGDGTNDFEITGVMDQSPNIFGADVNVNPLGSNQVAYSVINIPNTCDTVVALDFINNDTVSNVVRKWGISQNLVTYNYFGSSGCSEIFNGSGEGIIGVRLINATDTFYGWISVSAVGYYGCVVEAYACSLKIKEPAPITPYPNPSNGIITFPIGNAWAYRIQIYNVLGQEIYSASANPNITQVDLSNQASGLYLYRVINYKGAIISWGKFMIVKKKM
jgi:hypothetical protein